MFRKGGFQEERSLMARAYWRSGVACNTSAPRCVVGSLLVESQRIGVIVMDKLRLSQEDSTIRIVVSAEGW